MSKLVLIKQEMSQLPSVHFVPARHREQAIIKIVFDYHKELIERVKVLPGSCWSQTMKCWYVPDTEPYRRRFKIEVSAGSEDAMPKLCPANKEALHCFVQELQLKVYSRSTVTTYRNEFF